MPSQETTPLGALDALEQHTPRHVVHETLRQVAEDLAQWENDGDAVPAVVVWRGRPSIIEQALTYAIAERIGLRVEQGTEDYARQLYGEETVDDWFRAEGWDPDAGRDELAA
jgi:hypothetical protein